VKVLEEKPWTLKVTCKECKSELEVEASDVRALEWESGDCDHTSYTTKCAVCKSSIDLKFHDIAPGVREEAVRKHRKSKKRRW
jgi:hypothetical protein